MFSNLLNSDNYISYNIKLAHAIGLNAAIYCNELVKIFAKAKAKNKLVDNDYIKLDRKYIYDRTCLSIEDQLIVDANLSKINLISKNKDNPDIIKLDIQLLASLISNEDVKLLDDISKRVKVKTPKGIRASQRQRNIIELKDSIECSNYELLTALRNWVDAIYTNPSAYLSRSAIKIFQDTLNNYTKGDLDLALRLVQIATIQSYKDCSWAIAVYEKDLAIAKNQAAKNNFTNKVRVSEQKRASVDTLSDDIF